MEIFTIIKSDVSARIQEIAELIAEIREPLREEVEKKAEEPEMKAQNKEELKKKQKALADQERAKKVDADFEFLIGTNSIKFCFSVSLGWDCQSPGEAEWAQTRYGVGRGAKRFYESSSKV